MFHRFLWLGLCLAVTTVATSVAVRAWGIEGHQVIADVAEARLTPAAARKVAEILKGERLRDVAYWADMIRPQRRETARWHFVNIEPSSEAYQPERDCKLEVEGDCIIAAITRNIHDLQTEARRYEALKFLTHLVADLHQPFHAVTEGRGATRIRVTYFGRSTNLHAVWDSDLVRQPGRSAEDYAAHLQSVWLAKRDVEELTKGTTIDWALISRSIGLKALVLDGSALGSDYVTAHAETIDQQLATAGLRLAHSKRCPQMTPSARNGNTECWTLCNANPMMIPDTDLAAMAEILERSEDFRILRRLKPVL